MPPQNEEERQKRREEDGEMEYEEYPYTNVEDEGKEEDD